MAAVDRKSPWVSPPATIVVPLTATTLMKPPPSSPELPEENAPAAARDEAASRPLPASMTAASTAATAHRRMETSRSIRAWAG